MENEMEDILREKIYELFPENEDGDREHDADVEDILDDVIKTNSFTQACDEINNMMHKYSEMLAKKWKEGKLE